MFLKAIEDEKKKERGVVEKTPHGFS